MTRYVEAYVEAYVDWQGIVQDWRRKDEKLATFTFFASSLYYIGADFSKSRARGMCSLLFCRY